MMKNEMPKTITSEAHYPHSMQIDPESWPPNTDISNPISCSKGNQ